MTKQAKAKQAAMALETESADVGAGLRYLTSPERLEDAIELARLGLGHAVIAELTGWQYSFVNRICAKVGGRATGGRVRSFLLGVFRVPVLHATISRFAMAIDHQIAFHGGDRTLNARMLVGAINCVRNTMPEEVRQIPISALYSVAVETAKRTVKVTECSRCRNHYANASVESRLTDIFEVDCPFCRQIDAMLPSKKEAGEHVIPKSLSDLNLRKPLTRYPRKGVSAEAVRAVMGLVNGMGTGRGY